MTGGRATAAATAPVGYALARATRAHRGEMQRQMSRLGLHLGQELLVLDIHQNPDTTQAELVARIGMEQPTIAKAIARMERSGFVERVSDRHDRRLVRLQLTDQGRAVVDDIVAAWAAVEDRATSGLTPAEAAQLAELLDKIHDNLA